MWVKDSHEDYLAKKALSSHGLMNLLKSPEHFHHYLTNSKEPSDAMNFGKMVHLALLEPELIEKIVVEPEGKKQSSAFRKELEEWRVSLPPDVIVTTPKDKDKLLVIRDKVQASSEYRSLIKNGVAETSGYLVEEDDFKLRPDYRRTDTGLIIDIKTTRNTDIKSFQRDIINFHYDLQAYFYTKYATAISHKLGDNVTYSDFVWVCIEPEAPHHFEIFYCEQEWFQVAEKKFLRALETYKNCFKNGQYIGMKHKVTGIKPPPWYLAEHAS